MHQGPASGTQRSYSEVLRDALICSFGFGKSRLAAAWAYQPLCQRAAPPDLMQRALCSHSCTCWLWNVMMKSTNNQTPRSEGWLFYPLLLMWSVANCLNCFFLNSLCNAAAMVLCRHEGNWVTLCASQFLLLAPLLATGKKRRKDQLFLIVSVWPGNAPLSFLLAVSSWHSKLVGP